MKVYKSATIKLDVSQELVVSELYKFLVTTQEYGEIDACKNIARNLKICLSKVFEITGIEL
jgi:hypothetical protein